MKRTSRLIFSAAVALLALAAFALLLTRSWVSTGEDHAWQAGAQSKAVDEKPLQQAQRLASLAVSDVEQQYAQQTLRFADNEVDLAFESALRDAASSHPVLNAEAKELLARVQRRQARVEAEQAEVTRLTQLAAKAPASRKDLLQQQAALAQAQLSLDQDELADAHQDLIRAGGDPHSQIQEMLQLHEQSEVHKGSESLGANSSRESAVENTIDRSAVAQFRAWKSLNSKQQQLDSARKDALALAAKLSSVHQFLESQTSAPQQAANFSESSKAAKPSTLVSPQPAPPSQTSADTAAAISRFQRMSNQQKDLFSFDKRIEDAQSLAAAYQGWSSFVQSRERSHLRGLLVAVSWILLIIAVVLLSDSLMERVLRKINSDRKRMLTLRSVLNVTARTIGVVLILLLIFGVPSQFATVLALAGAGLTVALKDFIVGFLGWFVLMGANGIRPGDWVEINGVAGEVFEVGLLHTVLLETGSWSDAGHPTGRKVTFVNSFAIEGHYFNFSTSGQWTWDELQVSIPAGKDPYAIADEIKKIVAQETEKNARLAEQEWERVTLDRGSAVFKVEPAMNLRPTDAGVSVAIRYIARANERHELRSRLYRSVLDLLHRKKIPKASEALSPQPVPESD